MTRQYRYIFFDADDTLIDFPRDAERAFRVALREVGREGDDVLHTCVEFDFGNWDVIGLSDVHLPAVQERFHALYREHVRAIFRHADSVHGLDWERAEEAFMRAFAREGHEIEGALETVANLKERYKVFAATNGLTALQRGRLACFPLDGVFVSEEIGIIKPHRAFFTRILDELGATPEECLMVGDSIKSDVRGANLAGIDVVWFNRHRAPRPADAVLKAEIHELKELLEIL